MTGLWRGDVFPSARDQAAANRHRPHATIEVEGRTCWVLVDGERIWGVSTIENYGPRRGIVITQAWHLASVVRTVIERRATRR